ncbi:MAG TPA: hypothetical protein ENL20_07155 [Candidatus Cloacimonetes bacterium]|nr:hypothetical protein [Candidatus Cloacimonadota bacterium]
MRVRLTGNIVIQRYLTKGLYQRIYIFFLNFKFFLLGDSSRVKSGRIRLFQEREKLGMTMLFLCFFIFLFSEETELRPYKLINADTLIARKINEEYITNLKGNVHFFYGETEFYTDFAEIFEKKKVTRMIGNVKVFDDTLSLFSDKVDYYRLTEQLFLEGNVFIQETHQDSTIRTFETDRAEYYRNDKNLIAIDNVIAFDEREDLRGTCGYLTYNMNDGYGYLIKSPILTAIGEDSLTISAEKIEYYKEFQKIVTTFNVVSESKDFTITSDFLLYFKEENKAFYLGNPKFISEMAIASANEFQLFLDERTIKYAILKDSCRVDFKSEENEEMVNWITSENMEFNFVDGHLEICEATTNVDSYFKQDEKEDKDFAINEAQGDKLTISINSDEEIDQIGMQGRVSGKYKFLVK